jgi:hypothetical protein
MCRHLIGLCLVTAVTTACGGNDDGSPTSPSPTTSSIAVTLQGVVLVGKTAVATATATLSNGQTQPVTTGWRSDAPAVATVSDSGTVTGVANGQANISVTFGGQQGTRNVRVAPSYGGAWSGQQLIATCSSTGDLSGLCNDEDIASTIGHTFPVALTARHPGDLAVSGEFVVEGEPFPTFSSQIEPDGSIRFSGTVTVEGVRLVAAWQMNSTQDGRATGSVRETYSLPGLASGELVIDSTLTGFTRTAATASRTQQTSLRRLTSGVGRRLGRFRR